MNTLLHQEVGEGDAGGGLAHPHLASARLRRLFLRNLQTIRPAKTASDDPERLMTATAALVVALAGPVVANHGVHGICTRGGAATLIRVNA
jgi:hypothetical protein